MLTLRKFIPKNPEIRPASRDEVLKISRPLWLLLNQYNDGNRSELIMTAALSLVANLAYCAIDANEREQKNRAKIIPSVIHQRLLFGDSYDFTELMRNSLDFPDIVIVRTNNFVAIVIPARKNLIIGIRGTQFSYDWTLNLWATKHRSLDGRRFHSGFHREACLLYSKLEPEIFKLSEKIKKNHTPELYFTGHSLGGAIAAIINQMPHLPFPSTCYTFGTPRICSDKELQLSPGHIAIRRELDIVPHCPPRFLNYGEYRNQRRVDGTPYERIDGIEIQFFLSWLATMALRSFPAHHSMDLYVKELMSAVKNHPEVAPYWRADYENSWSDSLNIA